MNKFFKLFRKNKKSPNVSAMLIDIAGKYITMGDDENDKQHYLNSAVSAWNIACLQMGERKKALIKYKKNYRRMNPSHTQHDFADIIANIQLLINRKDKLYPYINIQIAQATRETRGSQEHVTVVSIRQSRK